jgi:hypothetical protein
VPANFRAGAKALPEGRSMLERSPWAAAFPVNPGTGGYTRSVLARRFEI